jgi:plastocyanin
VALFAVGLAPANPAAALSGRVVTSGGEPVEDAVVFVRQPPSGVAVDSGPKIAVMDQVDKQFVPHVLPIVVGTEVRFPNHDQIHHHVYSFSRTKMFEIPLYKGEEARPVLFDREGAAKIGCNIHDWMSAVILVLPTPFFAKTGADGVFRIDHLPAGRYRIAVWHERSKAALDATERDIDVPTSEDVVWTLDVSAGRERPRRGLRDYE